jgi:hypothetical protein
MHIKLTVVAGIAQSAYGVSYRLDNAATGSLFPAGARDFRHSLQTCPQVHPVSYLEDKGALHPV